MERGGQLAELGDAEVQVADAPFALLDQRHLLLELLVLV